MALVLRYGEDSDFYDELATLLVSLVIESLNKFILSSMVLESISMILIN